MILKNSRKNKITSFIVPALTLLVFVTGASAQINQLFGGNNQLKYRGNLSYEGASALGELSDLSTLYSRTGAVFGNPAGMMNIKKLQVQADFSLPGLGINTSTAKSDAFKDIIKEGMDGFLTEDNEVSPENRMDPRIGTDMAQTPGLDGLGVSLMISEMFPNFFKFPVGITAGYERLVDFSLGLDINDMVVGVGMPLDETDPGSDSIKARFSVQTGLALAMSMNRRGIGAAMEIPSWKLKYGLAAHQYMAVWDFNAAGEINGYISMNQEETPFNTVGAGHTDDLRVNYTGSGVGSAPGFAFGSNWAPVRWFGIDFAGSWNGTISLGDARGEHYMLHAIDQEECGGDEVFNVSCLNLTKVSLTKKVTNNISNVELHLPSRVGGSMYLNFRPFKLNIDYAYYYRPFILTYDHVSKKDVFDTAFNDVVKASDGTDSMKVERSSGEIGSYLQHKAAVGVKLWGLFMNAGVYVGDPILHENDRAIPVKILPIFNVGYSVAIRKKYSLDMSIISLPLAVLRTTIRYHI